MPVAKLTGLSVPSPEYSFVLRGHRQAVVRKVAAAHHHIEDVQSMVPREDFDGPT
jgi:hypothetical protein